MGKDKKKKKKKDDRGLSKAERRAEKERRREMKKKRKKAEKATMTSAERKRRKLEKKMKQRTEFFGYTNEDNPFGDSNLMTPFTWHKKHEKDERLGKARKPTKKDARRRRTKLIDEVKKVQARREEREKEKEEQEELRVLEARLREAEQYEDWEKKEEDFHAEQAKRRSVIRIQEGREKVIDMLAKNYLIFAADDEESRAHVAELDMELAEPYKIIENLPLRELEELQDDIKQYQRMAAEKGGTGHAYWRELMAITRAELQKVREQEAAAAAGGRKRGAIHQSVEEQMVEMFDGKTVPQLEKLARQIQSTIDGAAGGGGGIDVEYWEGALRQLEVYKAKANLKEMHRVMLMKRLDQLGEQRATLGDAGGAPPPEEAAELSGGEAVSPELEADDGNFSPELIGGPGGSDEDCAEEAMSPLLLGSGAEIDEADAVAGEVVDEEEDLKQLKLQRQMVLHDAQQDLVAAASNAAAANPDESAEAQSMYNAERAKGMEDGDELLVEQAVVPAQIYMWTDKYRPRKPRYFNRVKTGYDWNKYNQTHYDHDNPPPKTVQGYKFNIFYPDLIDRSKPPQYFLEPAESKDFCIIRFHAGPPYEDIAFQIVNSEWAYARKRGFRCSFERGILNLYFNFKRHMYRR